MSLKLEGFGGDELKHADFDALIFEGKSEAIEFLWVHDEMAEKLEKARNI